MERDRAHPLGGWVELDDAYLGGERSGGVNGYVEPRIFGERDLVRMGGPASAVAVNTQEIFSEDRR